jgi:hypothetical protein
MMQRKKRKKKPSAPTTTESSPPPPTSQEGLPNPESVIGSKPFVSPKGRKYLIIKTTEADPADEDSEDKKEEK